MIELALALSRFLAPPVYSRDPGNLMFTAISGRVRLCALIRATTGYRLATLDQCVARQERWRVSASE